MPDELYYDTLRRLKEAQAGPETCPHAQPFIEKFGPKAVPPRCDACKAAAADAQEARLAVFDAEAKRAAALRRELIEAGE